MKAKGYIQTENGLVALSGTSEKVTKDTIISALGYAPSDFDKNYFSLTNRPEISDDNSDTLYIADSLGNIIARVDTEGLHVTNLYLGDKNLDKIIKDVIGGVTPSITDYNDLENHPEILEDESDTLHITDQEGNIIAKITKDGLFALNFYVGGEIEDSGLNKVARLKDIPDGDSFADLVDVAERASALANNVAKQVENLTEVSTKVESKVMAVEQAAEEAQQLAQAASQKATTAESLAKSAAPQAHTHSFDDLANKPLITDDNSDTLNIVDESSNIIAKVNIEGIHSTNFYANGERVALLKDIPEQVSFDEINSKIESLEQKAEAAYNKAESLENIGNLAEDIEAIEKKLEILDGLDNIAETVVKVQQDVNNALDIATGAKTLAQNAAPNIHKHSYDSLDNKPLIIDDLSDTFNITDESGNIIASVDADGIRVTNIYLVGDKTVSLINKIALLEEEIANLKAEITQLKQA